MGGSPPPCHGYVCANGTSNSGCNRSRNVTNCKSCNSGYHLFQNHWSEPGPQCRLKVYPYCHNGEPIRNYWSWSAYHHCERCYSSFHILHHLQCKRRVDRLDWGHHAPTYAFPGNRGGTTLSSYYYIMFLNQHLDHAGWTPPVGIYMDADSQYWIESSSIPRKDGNVDLHHTLPSYGTTWELGIYIYRAQYNKLFRSGGAHRTSGWIHIKPEFRTVRVKNIMEMEPGLMAIIVNLLRYQIHIIVIIMELVIHIVPEFIFIQQIGIDLEDLLHKKDMYM